MSNFDISIIGARILPVKKTDMNGSASSVEHIPPCALCNLYWSTFWGCGQIQWAL